MTALIIAGIIGPLYVVPYWFLVTGCLDLQNDHRDLSFLVTFVAMIYTYIVTFVYGIPAITILETFNRLNLRNITAVAAIPGIILIIFAPLQGFELAILSIKSACLQILIPSIIVSAGCYFTFKVERNSEIQPKN